ncbi:hypothetical protein Nmel_017613 [Mimus melanotis]
MTRTDLLAPPDPPCSSCVHEGKHRALLQQRSLLHEHENTGSAKSSSPCTACPSFFRSFGQKAAFSCLGDIFLLSDGSLDLFVHGLCSLPGLAPGKSASPYLVPGGELTCSILHGAGLTSRVETPLSKSSISTSLGIPAPGMAVHLPTTSLASPGHPSPMG